MSRRAIFELAGFQIVWLASALGAAQGSSVPGVITALVFVALQLVIERSARMLLSGGIAAIVGVGLETLLARSGLVAYAAPWPGPGIAPLWIMTLWLAYGTTMASTVRLLGARPFLKATALGAVFGPLAYMAGARIGALSLSDPLLWTCAVLALAWAIVLPILVAIDGYLAQRV